MILLCMRQKHHTDTADRIAEILGIDRDFVQDDGSEGCYDDIPRYQRYNIVFSVRRECILSARKIYTSKTAGVLKILAGYEDMPWYPVERADFKF